MPAIITHDTFGQDVYRELFEFIGGSRSEYEAFLLGNQGPDPLFFSVLVPRLRKFTKFGSTMHSEKPNEALVAFKQSLSILDEKEYSIGRAYFLGFLCHYILDSNMHPLVYHFEHELCGAGIEDLDHDDNNEVHAVIESEFDEMVLFTKRGETVATFNPAKRILRADDLSLSIISKMYSYVAMVAYGSFLPKDMFKSSVKAYRRAQQVFHSGFGVKRAALGRIEETFRKHSFYRSMSPRAIEITESIFDNHEHSAWKNPFTDEASFASFWDIYEESLEKARDSIKAVDKEGFGAEEAADITGHLDFSGCPTVAILTVEDTE